MRETPVSLIRTGGQRLVLAGGSGGEAVVPLHRPVTLRNRRVTTARPAGPTTGVNTRQSDPPQKAGRNIQPSSSHTVAASATSMEVPRCIADLYPQATPGTNDPMTVTNVPMSPLAVQAGLLLVVVAGMEATR